MSTSQSPRILFVEDNPDVRRFLKYLLQDDYDIVPASDAEEALDVLDAGPFDLLLLDIKLGARKSGTELLPLLREREPAVEAPAIARTTYGMPGDREKLLDKGFDEHVSKPFSTADLTNTIDRVLL
jgi:Response regulator containing CheY-like receiver, AAA-type ATPase, and DNA-binding domains